MANSLHRVFPLEAEAQGYFRTWENDPRFRFFLMVMQLGLSLLQEVV